MEEDVTDDGNAGDEDAGLVLALPDVGGGGVHCQHLIRGQRNPQEYPNIIIKFMEEDRERFYIKTRQGRPR